MTQTDLTNCDREPIHVPGKIQSHGFLVAIDEGCIIRFCSDNAADYLGNTSSLLGRPVEDLEEFLQSDKGGTGYLRQFVLLATHQDSLQRINTRIGVKGKFYNLLINTAEPYRLLEFEPELSSLEKQLQQQVGQSLSEMLADRTLDTLLQNTVEQVRQIIAYDRVMVYKFHEDGHGEVVAESREGELESWLGLHYPASDIPKQARELYKINLVRLIADVNAEPSPISTDQAGSIIDLTHSSLRAVSPIHIQYLKNMKVASSFSVSLLDQDKLWGLIACHNYTPRFINFEQRESAKLIGQVLSSAISFRQQQVDQQRVSLVRSSIETISRNLLRNVPVPDALINAEINIQAAIESTGAALYYENELFVTGDVPDRIFLLDLITWLSERPGSELYATDNLASEFTDGARYKAKASGVLACRLSPDLKEYLIWFRPERIATVKWAGNPEKQVEVDQDGMKHISPRHSFEVWSETKGYTSSPWTVSERDSALLLRDEVNYLISRKATELRAINERLREAYAELDTFSYTIAHDLKNPLTTIKSFSELIQRIPTADEKIRHMAARIQGGATRMHVMIDEVLQYSKVGQSKAASGTVDMAKLLNELKQDLLVAENNPKLEIRIGNTPDLQGDEVMITQVFSNLAGNAVKYSGKAEQPEVVIDGMKDQDGVTYTISDNGIGIDPADHEKIFDLFTRSKSGAGFEGTGVGLAIVRRIMDKHQGKIWLESKPGEGTRFYVRFKN